MYEILKAKPIADRSDKLRKETLADEANEKATSTCDKGVCVVDKKVIFCKEQRGARYIMICLI